MPNRDSIDIKTDWWMVIKIFAVLFVVVALVIGAIKIIPPLSHAIYWQFVEAKPAPTQTALDKANEGIHEASAPPIVESAANNDASPKLTGYEYVFPSGTLDFKQVISSTVVKENANFNNGVAYNDIVVTYLCLMRSDYQSDDKERYLTNIPHEVWRTCQPVIRKVD